MHTDTEQQLRFAIERVAALTEHVHELETTVHRGPLTFASGFLAGVAVALAAAALLTRWL